MRLGGEGQGVLLLPQVLGDYRNDVFLVLFTPWSVEGTFLTLKIYTLESLKQNISISTGDLLEEEHRKQGNVPAPQTVPFRGKVAVLST